MAGTAVGRPEVVGVSLGTGVGRGLSVGVADGARSVGL